MKKIFNEKKTRPSSSSGKALKFCHLCLPLYTFLHPPCPYCPLNDKVRQFIKRTGRNRRHSHHKGKNNFHLRYTHIYIYMGASLFTLFGRAKDLRTNLHEFTARRAWKGWKGLERRGWVIPRWYPSVPLPPLLGTTWHWLLTLRCNPQHECVQFTVLSLSLSLSCAFSRDSIRTRILLGKIHIDASFANDFAIRIVSKKKKQTNRNKDICAYAPHGIGTVFGNKTFFSSLRSMLSRMSVFVCGLVRLH